MDYEVVRRLCIICDWMLNSSWNHFGSHQGKNVRVTIEFEVSKRHILGLKWSIDMVQRVFRWERPKKKCYARKRQEPTVEKYCYNNILMNFLGRERKQRRQEKGQTCPFWAYIWKKSIHSLFGAWSFLLVHIWFTPSEDKLDHGIMPYSMVWLHGPWCKPAQIAKAESYISKSTNLAWDRFGQLTTYN
jgi:hypothetical protein